MRVVGVGEGRVEEHSDDFHDRGGDILLQLSVLRVSLGASADLVETRGLKRNSSITREDEIKAIK